jgi:hypothetical protein
MPFTICASGSTNLVTADGRNYLHQVGGNIAGPSLLCPRGCVHTCRASGTYFHRRVAHVHIAAEKTGERVPQVALNWLLQKRTVATVAMRPSRSRTSIESVLGPLNTGHLRQTDYECCQSLCAELTLTVARSIILQWTLIRLRQTPTSRKTLRDQP